jgi:acyl-CoA thioester hydrolase
MSGLPIYSTAIAPDWIDYNGHLRDAYYGLIVSLAIDEFMDRIGLHEAYRTRTRCTLYSLEMHVHFFREVKQTDRVDASIRILGSDRKRIHAALDVWSSRFPEPAASSEVMLLHVHQGTEPKSHPFPLEVVAAIEQISAQCAAGGPGLRGAGMNIPGSRRMELRSRP